MYSANTFKIVHQNIRAFSNTAGICAKSHYDSLGITPKATQADVKGAYYKLSMLYHPDKNKGSGNAAQKFRDITAAYEVLGNLRLRRLYDKGVSHIGVDAPEEPLAKFYKSREQRTRPPSTGRTPIYDFDEWSRSHYGATFARNMERKRHAELYRNMVEKENQDIKTGRLLIAMGTLLGIFMYFTVGTRDHDSVTFSIGDNTITSRASKD